MKMCQYGTHFGSKVTRTIMYKGNLIKVEKIAANKPDGINQKIEILIPTKASISSDEKEFFFGNAAWKQIENRIKGPLLVTQKEIEEHITKIQETNFVSIDQNKLLPTNNIKIQKDHVQKDQVQKDNVQEDKKSLNQLQKTLKIEDNAEISTTGTTWTSDMIINIIKISVIFSNILFFLINPEISFFLCLCLVAIL